MRARVFVRLKRGVLDPRGEAIGAVLRELGFDGVDGVRVGKLVEVELSTDDAAAARASLEQMADKLLANPVMESFEVELRENAVVDGRRVPRSYAMREYVERIRDFGGGLS